MFTKALQKRHNTSRIISIILFAKHRGNIKIIVTLTRHDDSQSDQIFGLITMDWPGNGVTL